MIKPASLEDLNQLILDCKNGKREAQAKLYRMYSSKLYGVCLRYARDISEAEDFLHDGFMIIFEKIDQYAFRGSFEGWMRRIIVNLALERYRTRNRLHPVEDLNTYAPIASADNTYDSINVQELLELIKELPPRYKMVFNMYAIDGYSHKEIAEHMGITVGTSKSNLNRARQILQSKIEKLNLKTERYVR
jgi:RNA polymerase sigma-70 factor (ECF subfamily)